MRMRRQPLSVYSGAIGDLRSFAAGLISPLSSQQRIITDTMSVLNRRGFLETAIGAAAAHAASLATNPRPRLGVIAGVTGKTAPDQAIAKVHAFGLPTCQVSVGMAPASLATPLKDALAKYGVEATAVMTQGSGRMIWDFYDGPKTIGIVPPETRAARVDA